MAVVERSRSIELPPVALMGALACAMAALVLRGVGTWSFLVPVGGAAGVLVAQGRATSTSRTTTWLTVTAAGIAACAFVRFALPGAPLHATTLGLLASAVAAVCEEVIFRRGLYGAVERWGAPVAIAVTAAVFGIVHAPMYGWAVVPVDVSAGLVFGWQRWATGSWTSSAATHVVANVLGSI